MDKAATWITLDPERTRIDHESEASHDPGPRKYREKYKKKTLVPFVILVPFVVIKLLPDAR